MSKVKKESERLYEIIKTPLISEKSTSMYEQNKYTFEVAKDATKVEIKKAIELLFPGRKAKKVQTVYRPSHEKRRGKVIGRTQSGKKAIVTIEGEPIDELVGA